MDAPRSLCLVRIERLLKCVDERRKKRNEKWIVMLTTDHGGSDRGTDGGEYDCELFMDMEFFPSSSSTSSIFISLYMLFYDFFENLYSLSLSLNNDNDDDDDGYLNGVVSLSLSVERFFFTFFTFRSYLSLSLKLNVK